MKHNDLHNILDVIFRASKDMIVKKNQAYSSDDDALANFKVASDMLGMSPYQVWAIYFHKHTSAINKAIKDNPEVPEDKSEGFRTKIIDAICYLGLLYAMDIENHVKDFSPSEDKQKDIRKAFGMLKDQIKSFDLDDEKQNTDQEDSDDYYKFTADRVIEKLRSEEDMTKLHYRINMSKYLNEFV